MAVPMPRRRWTQWIFLQLFKKGLAYQAEVPVNWCPALGTVLANEEVCFSHGSPGKGWGRAVPADCAGPLHAFLATSTLPEGPVVRCVAHGAGRPGGWGATVSPTLALWCTRPCAALRACLCAGD